MVNSCRITLFWCVTAYGFRDLIAILAPDFGFNWENVGFWI